MNLDIMALLIKLYFQITLSSCKNHHTLVIKYIIKDFIEMNKAIYIHTSICIPHKLISTNDYHINLN